MSRNEQSGLEGGALKQLRILLKAELGDGLELLKDLEDNPICSISYDESDACIVVLWRRYATSTQLRFIHESIIGLIEKHGASKILGDDTALATIYVADQKWIAQNWMPRAMAAGLKVAARKSPTSYFGRLSVDIVQSLAPAGLAMRAFADMDDARRWLRSTNP